MKNSELIPLSTPEMKKKALTLLKKILRSIKLLGEFFSRIVITLDSNANKGGDKTAEIQAEKFMSMCITLNTLLRSSFVFYKYSTYLARVVILEDKRTWLKARNETKRNSKEFEGLHYLNKFVNTEDARRKVRLNSFNTIKNSGFQFRSMKNVYKKRGSVRMFGLNVEQVIKASEAGSIINDDSGTVIKESRQESSLSNSTISETSIEENSLINLPPNTTNEKDTSPIYSKTPLGRGNTKHNNFETMAENARKETSPVKLTSKTPRVRGPGFKHFPTKSKNERNKPKTMSRFGLQRKNTIDDSIAKIKDKEEKKKEFNFPVQLNEEVTINPKVLKKSHSANPDFQEFMRKTKENIIEIEEFTKDKLTLEEFLAHLNLDLHTNLDHVFNSSLEEVLQFFNSVEKFMIQILGGQELEVKIDLIKLIIRTTNAETFTDKIFMVSLMKLGFLQQWQTFDLFIQVLKYEMKLGIGF